MIKLIVYDFDGVLTDNRVWISETGQEWVSCHRGDGWWIGQIRKLGIEQYILSTETNPVVSSRGKKLNVPVLQGTENKSKVLRELMEAKQASKEEVVYVGNEMNDFECLELVTHSFAPSDSHPKILERVAQILPEKGGHGVVRHLYDWLVRTL